MQRVAAPLTEMGARITFEGATGHDGLPMRVYGQPLTSLRYVNSHASAQVKGALLLAGLSGGVEVTIEEPVRSRDHSERMLTARGVRLEITDGSVTLPAGQVVLPADVVVPSDPSSATFFAARAAMADAGELRLENVCLNPTRTGAFDVLRRMGADIVVEQSAEAFTDQPEADAEDIERGEHGKDRIPHAPTGDGYQYERDDDGYARPDIGEDMEPVGAQQAGA
jgi:3-phosphoshikimate 1-carboxyvinyltransferase